MKPATTAPTLLQGSVNVLGFGLLVWFGGPLVAIADVRPLETQAARLLVLLAAGAAFVLAGPLRQWQMRRRNAALVDVLQPPAGAQSLAPRFQQALSLLRDGVETTSGGPPLLRWWRRRQQLVRLPWYLFIGAPGAGKTTALLHSGLRFPLADKLGTAPVRGVAGTRQCDWWFTQQAVFIDTAGRYTTQDSDAAADAREWRSFLGLLRKHRPRQPINGVLVTVSVPDLLAGGAELARQCAAVNARLQELRNELGLSLPVYVLVTKADLLAGFTEFFDVLDGEQRAQVWGTTFAHADGAKLRGPARPSAEVLAADLQALVERIQAITLDRLQQESAAARRSPIYHFAAQLDALLPALTAFADAALAHADEPPRQHLRGVYLSSGTQEGNPIDRVLGAIARQHGVPERALVRPDGKGKAYFLNRLLQGVVIQEAELAGDNVQRLRKLRLAWLAAGSAAALAMLALIGAWLLSYGNNRAHIAGVGQRVQQLAQQAATPSAPSAPAAPSTSSAPSATTATTASSSTRWLPLYEVLRDLPRDLPHQRGVPTDAVPPGHGFGLFQGARLARSAQQTYHRVLANTLAPVLADRLAAELRQAEGDPALRYQTLKTYLMLVQPERLDRATVRAWAAASFARGPDPPVDAAQRDEWLRHVDALLERNGFQDAVLIDTAAVQAAQKALAAVPLPRRALARLVRDEMRDEGRGARPEPPRRLDSWLGPSFVLLFDPKPAKTAVTAATAATAVADVNPLFTREAFTTRVLPRLDATLQQLADEEGWVLGLGNQRSEQWRAEPAGRAAVAAEVVKLYAAAHADQWQAALDAWQLHRPADADALARLNTQLAAADSPLRKLLELARTELRFVDAGAEGAAKPLAKLADAVLAERFGALRAYAGGPGPAAIDRVLAVVARFTLAAGGDAGGAQLAQSLQQEATQAPAPFNAIWRTLAEALLAAQQTALRQGLVARLDDVAAQCRSLTANRYPFSATATQNDVSLADFARLFGHDGLLDVFFRKELLPNVDTRSRPWRYREGMVVAGDSLLRSFERAEDIRRVFFSPGAPLPRLQFTLRPVEMDDALEEFAIDIDGQTLRYENGPRVQRSFTWPGPAGATRVILRAKGLAGEGYEGPWALLRVLTRQPWERGESPASSRVSVSDHGRRLVLDLGLQGSASTGVLASLASFRCPEARP